VKKKNVGERKVKELDTLVKESEKIKDFGERKVKKLDTLVKEK